MQKEDLIQATGIKLIKKLCPKCIISQSLSGINLSLFEKLSIPNNIKARLRIERNKEIARLKATGWVKGIPDITVFCPKGIVVFFEFKTSNGKQSKEQKEIEKGRKKKKEKKKGDKIIMKKERTSKKKSQEFIPGKFTEF